MMMIYYNTMYTVAIKKNGTMNKLEHKLETTVRTNVYEDN